MPEHRKVGLTHFFYDIENARNVNTEADDMFGASPASCAEVLAAQRAKGESWPRFSINPNLREDVEAALKKGVGPDSGQKKRHKNIYFSEPPAVFEFLRITKTANRFRYPSN